MLVDDEATVRAWTALGGSAELARDVSYQRVRGVLPSRLPVRELARATVGVCSLAAAELLAQRNSVPVPVVRVHEGAVATAFTSERHLRIDGRAATPFAPLSGFWRAANGWVRTHANYPHHRSRLLSALRIRDTGDDRSLIHALSDELATHPADWTQEAVYAAGGLAVAVRPAPAADAAMVPLVEARTVGETGPRALPAAPLPASGVRVVDLTRVIAGPVATRTLALLGADVVRVDSPRLPEDPDSHADTGMGKRSALLDFAVQRDRRVVDELLESADVVVVGYRPGALHQHGLAAEVLHERFPGLIVAELSAWGWSGPWAARRGFDSLVQAASGIAAVETGPDGRPGALPAQALDHGSGYLLAAAVLRALTDRHVRGGGRHLRLSLAGTAAWLLHGIRATADEGDIYEPQPWLAEMSAPCGQLRYALSPIGYNGVPATWIQPPSHWGADSPDWT